MTWSSCFGVCITIYSDGFKWKKKKKSLTCISIWIAFLFMVLFPSIMIFICPFEKTVVWCHDNVRSSVPSMCLWQERQLQLRNYPHLTGNIPRQQTYGISKSQEIRYWRLCSLKEDLMDRILELTKKLYRKKFKIEGLKNTVERCLEKHEWIEKKFK